MVVQRQHKPPSSSRNPDNLESILPSSLIPTHEFPRHSHGPHSDSWVWDSPSQHQPPTVRLTCRGAGGLPGDVTKQEYTTTCDSQRRNSSTWQNLCELPDALSQFFCGVVDSGHDLMADGKHHEQQLLPLHQVGSPTSQWQMNLQGVGSNNSDSFNPLAEWEAARCSGSSMAYGLSSESHAVLGTDLYMLDPALHHGNASSSLLQYPAYDNGDLFPHLIEESVLYV